MRRAFERCCQRNVSDERERSTFSSNCGCHIRYVCSSQLCKYSIRQPIAGVLTAVGACASPDTAHIDGCSFRGLAVESRAVDHRFELQLLVKMREQWKSSPARAAQTVSLVRNTAAAVTGKRGLVAAERGLT